jgi:hypothetical protein
MGNNSIMGYYVYAYLRDSSDDYGPAGSPYYIGKGTTGSGRETSKHIQRIGRKGTGMRDLVPEDLSQIVILKDGMTELQAYELEAELIAFYGRVDLKTGCLWNLNDGGTGGQSNYLYPEYLREMRRDQLKGNNYGSRVDWSDPEVKRRHAEGVKNRVMPPKTAAGFAADENLKIPYDWQHPEKGVLKGVCCVDMERKTGHHQSGFWLVANGKSGSTHGWICLNPKLRWVPKEVDTTAVAEAAARARTLKNAEALGLSVDEYRAMDYSARSRLRKKLGIKSEMEIDAERAGMSLAEWKKLSPWDRKVIRAGLNQKLADI